MWEVSHILTKLTPTSAAQGPLNRRCAASNVQQQKSDFTPPTVSADMRSCLLKHFPVNWKQQSRVGCRIYWELWYRRFQFHPQQVGNLNNWHLNPDWPPRLQATKLMGWFSHDFPVSLQQRTKQHKDLCDPFSWWTDDCSFLYAIISNYLTLPF